MSEQIAYCGYWYTTTTTKIPTLKVEPCKSAFESHLGNPLNNQEFPGFFVQDVEAHQWIDYYNEYGALRLLQLLEAEGVELN